MSTKSLHITLIAAPYGSETAVTVFRLVDAALDKGHDVRVLAYEDGVLLSARAQNQHSDPIWKDTPGHHTDAGLAHSTTAEFVERLLEKGHQEPHLDWYV